MGEWWRFLLHALILTVSLCTVQGGNVTYDRTSLIINGHHEILFSGSIHYPRSTPQVTSSHIYLVFFGSNLYSVLLLVCNIKVFLFFSEVMLSFLDK